MASANPIPKTAPEAVRPPRCAEWVSTLRCSLRCRHCAASAGRAAPGELGTSEARAMLAALADFGVQRLCISGGEPTMRPDWEPLLAEALRLFRAVRFLTNGRLGAELLARAGLLKPRGRLTVVVSIDGLRAKHDARRGAGSFAAALATLEAPGAVAREVISTMARDNLSEVDALADLCLAHGVRFWTLQPALPLGRLLRRDSLGARGAARLAQAAERIERRSGRILRVASSDPARWHDQAVIRPDGGIAVCQLCGGRAAGNIRRDDLEAVWNGKALARLRAVSVCPAWRRSFGSGAERA